MKFIIRLTLRVENRILQLLLARFACRQITASNSRQSSEMIDCATVLLDEVAQ